MDTTTLTSVRTPMSDQLAAQNRVGLWRFCTDRGLKHRWVRREVSPDASHVTRLRADLDGYFTCQRKACPAARFGKS
jgi:hypothetical protein